MYVEGPLTTVSMIGFYSRPIEAAETTMWADLAPALAIHNSTQGSRPVLTKLSLFDFCDRTGTGIFLVRFDRCVQYALAGNRIPDLPLGSA